MKFTFFYLNGGIEDNENAGRLLLHPKKSHLNIILKEKWFLYQNSANKFHDLLEGTAANSWNTTLEQVSVK